MCESAPLPFASESQRKKKVSRQVVLFNDELRFDEKIDLRNQSQQQTLSESNFERLRAKLTNSPVVSNAVGNSAAPSQIKQILQVYSTLQYECKFIKLHTVIQLDQYRYLISFGWYIYLSTNLYASLWFELWQKVTLKRAEHMEQ